MQTHHEEMVRRFAAASQADERVVAAFLGGSHARGTADALSDLDLYVIVTDEVYDGFVVDRAAFIRLLGEPVFLEDFDIPDIAFFILADGTEGELGMGRESRFTHLHSGPYRVLVDKKDLLAGVVFDGPGTTPVEQLEQLRCTMVWFWHEMSHFVTAMGREQLWWASGQLEALRTHCVRLARFRQDLSDRGADNEPYFKIEQALPAEQLFPLSGTYGPQEPVAMLQAPQVLVNFYRELATSLGREHGLSYPAAVERIMLERLGRTRAGFGLR